MSTAVEDHYTVGDLLGVIREGLARLGKGTADLYPEVASRLLRVTETGHWLEWVDWAESILAEPCTVENGHLIPRDVPGNGLEWDEDAVQRYRLEP
ncbi:MAG: hypothetical protein ACE1Y3_01005 [Rhodospirillales bacterium]